jgi:predicted acyltransferase
LNSPLETTPSRIVSLDQFRGYTIAGMFFVNMVGGYACMSPTFGHHGNYFSYADTIMPQFFFAVGFAFRLTFGRTVDKLGTGAAYRKAIKRNLGLFLFGSVYYGFGNRFGSWAELQAAGFGAFFSPAIWGSIFQALVHIACTGLWLIPVIGASTRVLACFMAFTGALHLLLVYTFYAAWASRTGITDGGPLGFMSWAIPTLAGALACDWMRNRGPRRALIPILGWGVVLGLLGYALSCLTAAHRVVGGHNAAQGMGRWLVEPPFTPPSLPSDIWTMSQPMARVSYMAFGAGFCLVVYALFVIACDLLPLRIGVLRTLGTNALAAYLIHNIVDNALTPYVPNDAPLWYTLAGFSVFFGLCYLFLRFLEKNKLFLKL